MITALHRQDTKYNKKKTTFCGFPWVVTSTAGRVYDLCVYYMTGAPEGSPKVVYGEAGNRTCDPWFTRHSAYPLHHGGFSTPHTIVVDLEGVHGGLLEPLLPAPVYLYPKKIK